MRKKSGLPSGLSQINIYLTLRIEQNFLNFCNPTLPRKVCPNLWENNKLGFSKTLPPMIGTLSLNMQFFSTEVVP